MKHRWMTAPSSDVAHAVAVKRRWRHTLLPTAIIAVCGESLPKPRSVSTKTVPGDACERCREGVRSER